MSARRKRHFEQELFEFAQEDGERRKGVDELLAVVDEYAQPQRFLKLLARIAHFRDYSPHNALLIALQRPSARYVLTPRKWLSLGRCVKRGACPIIALRPFSPVMYLYDVSDTKVLSGRADGFESSWAEQAARDPETDVPPETLQTLLDNLPLWGISHGTFPMGPSLSVELHVANEADADLELLVDGNVVTCRPAYVLHTREGAPDTVVFTALVQALARIFCHHLRCGYERGWENSRHLSPEVEQFEIQAVSLLVCRRLQVASPSYSFWDDCAFERREVPQISLDTVCDAVTEIERMLEPCTVQQGYLYRHTPSFAVTPTST